MESDIIKISHLNKSFGEVKAVNDLSFRVKKGELFAFLGVNGAGKSTTISILCGLLKKDSGTVQVNGILYLMPQAWIWTIFAFILLFNIWILLKKVNPTYTASFKER